MIQIRPVSDLRNKFQDIEKAVGGGEPVFLTKNGYGSMVVLSLEAYSRLTDGIEAALDEADRAALETDKRYAHDLIDAVEKAILERQPVAEAFEPYDSLKERRYPYYRIYVKKFVIYYVVIDDEGEDKIMEVRRFLYQGQDRERLL